MKLLFDPSAYNNSIYWFSRNDYSDNYKRYKDYADQLPEGRQKSEQVFQKMKAEGIEYWLKKNKGQIVALRFDNEDHEKEIRKKIGGWSTAAKRSKNKKQRQDSSTFGDDIDLELASQTLLPPDLTGVLAAPTEKALDVHSELRMRISELKTVPECVQFFDCDLRFQESIRLLREAQNQFVSTLNTFDEQPAVEKREEWARLWAMALSLDEEWAWALNHCRKTALELLYKVCDLSFVFDPEEGIKWSDELEGTFKLRRIDEILGHCLVMDRANSLYNMMIRTTGEQGLGWYSKYDAAHYQEAFDAPLNPRGPTINKRLWWLSQLPELREDEAVQRWMQVSAPERLQMGAE